MRLRNWLFTGTGLGLSVWISIFDAHAQVDAAEVGERLSIMQRHVQELKLRAIPSARLRESTVNTLKLDRRAYRKGEKWAVRFEPTNDAAIASMARKASVADEGGTISTEPLLYDFEVLELAGDGNARIAITQRVASPEGRADRQVDHIVLVVSPRFTPVMKEIHYRDGRPPRSIAIAARGNFAMGFSATPTDLPNLATDDGVPMRDRDGSPALKFDTVDIYGRPVTTTWRAGDVWPAEVKTVSGNSTLLR
ncbi:MAG: hypothetical protein HY074_18045 [Deltaproteobacteria bacterium]|nr:hypothetical protein [Deltaproteobacteria bacterium]